MEASEENQLTMNSVWMILAILAVLIVVFIFLQQTGWFKINPRFVSGF